MRKTLAFVLATAFVATLPSLASAKTKRHRHAPVQVVDNNNNGAGLRLAGNALHQLVVPFEVTFGPRYDAVEPRHHHRKRVRVSRAPQQ